MSDKLQKSALFYQKYIIELEIGRGASGICYKIKRISDNKIFALKKISANSIKKNNLKAAYNEVSILSSLQHPNIIKYYESFIDDQELYIVMQYAQRGDLHSILKKRKIKLHFYEEHELWSMIGQLLNGLQYLHNKNIIHRDVKTLNIFVDQKGKVIIGDLGVSKILKSDLGLYSRVGTPLYLPPEIIKYQKYDFKADVWGLGCVAYLLATLNHPFQGKNIITLGQNIVSKNPKPIEKYSQNLQNLIFQMLQKNHKKRLSPSMILRKHFLGNQISKKEFKDEIRLKIQMEFAEQNQLKKNQQKPPPEKSFQRRYLTTKIMGKEGGMLVENNIEQKVMKHFHNEKNLRYLVGNFINQIDNKKKQQVCTTPIISNKTFENTIAIKPISKQDQEFQNGNEQITKCQKQLPNNSLKKSIVNSLSFKKKQDFPVSILGSLNPSSKKIEQQQKSEVKSGTFVTFQNKNLAQSAQCFRLFKENSHQLQLQTKQAQIYAEKKSNLSTRKMPTQTKYVAEIDNLKNCKHNSVADISEIKIIKKNIQLDFDDKNEKNSFIDIFRISKDFNFVESKNDLILNRKFLQRPKSSIGRKLKYCQNPSSTKPKRKENSYIDFYEIIETKFLKQPEVIIL